MLANGTQINNRAAIYFDYNEPIITNTVSLLVSAPVDVVALSNEKESLSAYPNPTANELFFVLNNPLEKIKQVEIFDLSGKRSVLVQSDQVSLQELPPGMYFFKVLTEKGKAYTGKVLKN